MAEEDNVNVETPEGEVPEAVESEATETPEPELPRLKPLKRRLNSVLRLSRPRSCRQSNAPSARAVVRQPGWRPSPTWPRS